MSKENKPPYLAYVITSLPWVLAVIAFIYIQVYFYGLSGFLITIGIFLGVAALMVVLGFLFIVISDFYHDQKEQVREYRRDKKHHA